MFKEEPHSIAIHPSGLYVLVGFTDKLRLLSLLMDDMRLVRELLGAKTRRLPTVRRASPRMVKVRTSAVARTASPPCTRASAGP